MGTNAADSNDEAMNSDHSYLKQSWLCVNAADSDDAAMNPDYSYLKQSWQCVNAADCDDEAMNLDRPTHRRKPRECRRPGTEGVNKGALLIVKY